MAFQVPAWAKNRKALAGIAAAGVVGAVVLIKRGKSSGGGSGGSSDTATVPTGSGQAGAYDSTSADIANQLGQYQTGLQTALGQYGADQQQQLADYQQQLTTSLSGLTSGQNPTSPLSLHQQHLAHVAHEQQITGTPHQQHLAHLAHVRRNS